MQSSMEQSQTKSSFPSERVTSPGNPWSPWPKSNTPTTQATRRLTMASRRTNASTTARRAGTREIQVGSISAHWVRGSGVGTGGT